MPRRLRKDYPGAWHHVMDRGVAKRTLFETRRDVRFFLSCLAWQVRAGDIEVHAYAVLTTHFHLLVRSPRGRLSRAMQGALDAYARWFNRSRRRDGPLFRGRFVNRVVETGAYWECVLSYIDRNPVSAGLAASPVEYPYGSARHYARGKGPPWLTRRAVEGAVRAREEGPWDPALYVRRSRQALTPGARWVVGRRLREATTRGGDPLDGLLGTAPDRVRAWMEEKTRIADGTAPGLAVASPVTLAEGVRRRSVRDPGRLLILGRRRAPWWEALQAGLLRLCTGLRHEEVGERMGLPLTTARKRAGLFAAGAAGDAAFLADAVAVLEEALLRDHGDRSAGRPSAAWFVSARDREERWQERESATDARSEVCA